jgi:hypothetical protein
VRHAKGGSTITAVNRRLRSLRILRYEEIFTHVAIGALRESFPVQNPEEMTCQARGPNGGSNGGLNGEIRGTLG